MNVGELLTIIREIGQAEMSIQQIAQTTGNVQLDMVAQLDPRVVQLRAYADKLRAIPLDFTPRPSQGELNGNQESPAEGGPQVPVSG